MPETAIKFRKLPLHENGGTDISEADMDMSELRSDYPPEMVATEDGVVSVYPEDEEGDEDEGEGDGNAQA